VARKNDAKATKNDVAAASAEVCGRKWLNRGGEPPTGNAGVRQLGSVIIVTAGMDSKIRYIPGTLVSLVGCIGPGNILAAEGLDMGAHDRASRDFVLTDVVEMFGLSSPRLVSSVALVSVSGSVNVLQQL